MKKFLVHYSEPMVVEIVAESEEEATELFLNGEYTDEYSDPDGMIGEPNLVLYVSDVEQE